MNIEDNDVIFENKDNLIRNNNLVETENFSNGIIEGNENIEISLGVQAERNSTVPDTPSLIQSSAKPLSLKSSIWLLQYHILIR
jgi:hypothetical protein